jgi:hypothetical protein
MIKLQLQNILIAIKLVKQIQSVTKLNKDRNLINDIESTKSPRTQR